LTFTVYVNGEKRTPTEAEKFMMADKLSATLSKGVRKCLNAKDARTEHSDATRPVKIT
jgi:hypothetical protein